MESEKTWLVMIDFLNVEGCISSRPICGVPSCKEALEEGARLYNSMHKSWLSDNNPDESQPNGYWAEPVSIYS